MSNSICDLKTIEFARSTQTMSSVNNCDNRKTCMYRFDPSIDRPRARINCGCNRLYKWTTTSKATVSPTDSATMRQRFWKWTTTSKAPSTTLASSASHCHPSFAAGCLAHILQCQLPRAHPKESTSSTPQEHHQWQGEETP